MMSGKSVTGAEIAGFLGVASDTRQQTTRQQTLSRVSAIESATGDSIVYAAEERSLAQAIASAAGMILVRAVWPAPAGYDDPRILEVDDPRTALARVYARWFSGSAQPSGIHPSALVSPLARIGLRCRIDPGAVIEADVELGDDCTIGPRAVIHSGTRLGKRVHVQAGAVLGSTGFGYVLHAGEHIPFPQIGTLTIEDDVDIGANTTIDRGALGETRIGRGTKIDNLVHIAHNCKLGCNVLIAAQVGMAGSTTIEDGAMLGGQAGLGEHVTIGRGVILGGQGGVLPGKTLEGEGVVFWGTPAQPVREFLRNLARTRRTQK